MPPLLCSCSSTSCISIRQCQILLHWASEASLVRRHGRRFVRPSQDVYRRRARFSNLSDWQAGIFNISFSTSEYNRTSLQGWTARRSRSAGYGAFVVVKQVSLADLATRATRSRIGQGWAGFDEGQLLQRCVLSMPREFCCCSGVVLVVVKA